MKSETSTSNLLQSGNFQPASPPWPSPSRPGIFNAIVVLCRCWFCNMVIDDYCCEISCTMEIHRSSLPFNICHICHFLMPEFNDRICAQDSNGFNGHRSQYCFTAMPISLKDSSPIPYSKVINKAILNCVFAFTACFPFLANNISSPAWIT